MVTSIELQIISKLLTTDENKLIDELCTYDESYYSVFRPHIHFILEHRVRYNKIPDIFTFQAEFPDITLVQVNETQEFLELELKKNKQNIILIETFNKLKDLGSGDVTEAWQYLTNQCQLAESLSATRPQDLVHEAKERADQVKEFSKRERIPTGFDEIDKLMYGGLSTVEELLLIVARTNTGKSWVCTKMMESAQKNGFPCMYYSPEMQASYLATRFDTWRGHFQNSQIYQGKYTEEYEKFIEELSKEDTPAFILEDKDIASGEVRTNDLKNLVKRYGIKLLIIDGLSYVEDSRKAYTDKDYTKYKNICLDLFKLSKQYGCAVVISMQANRETKDMKDEKGEPMPNLYAIEGSDHPGRICTQAFSIRQIFDKHVLDIRLEKSRMANNQKPIFSYSWEVNTGRMSIIQGETEFSEAITQSVTPVVSPNVSTNIRDDSAIMIDDNFEDDVEF